jgi:aminocarboxymuconate-semialdehyde decarboxylase
MRVGDTPILSQPRGQLSSLCARDCAYHRAAAPREAAAALLVNVRESYAVFVSCVPAHHAARTSAARGGRASAKTRSASEMRVRRGGRSLVIDLHCHVLTPAADDLVKPAFDPQTDPLFRHAGEATREVNRKQAGDIRDRISRLEPRLAEMDRMGVDMQALSVAPSQYFYWAQPELGRAAARLVNDNIAHIVHAHPDRFVGLGHLPMQQPEFALAELERCARELGMRGVEICTNVDGKDLSAPEFLPIFARLEQLGMVLFIHPSGFTHGERLREHYLNNVIGNPLESTIAVSHLIFGGVLDRHPKLKVVVPHGGGFVGSYPFRMDHAWRARADCRLNIRKKPTEYLKRLYFDTILFDPRALAHLIELWGADHVVLGTDYPYDMGDYDPLGSLAAVKGLRAEERMAIAGGNAAKLLGIRRRSARRS